MKKLVFTLSLILSYQSLASSLSCEFVLNTYSSTRVFSGSDLVIIERLAASLLSLKIDENEINGIESLPHNATKDLLRIVAESTVERLSDYEKDQISAELFKALSAATNPEITQKFREAARKQQTSVWGTVSFLNIVNESLSLNPEELRKFLRANIDAIIINAILIPNKTILKRIMTSERIRNTVKSIPGVAISLLGAAAGSEIYVGIGLGWLSHWYLLTLWSYSGHKIKPYDYDYSIGDKVRAGFRSL